MTFTTGKAKYFATALLGSTALVGGASAADSFSSGPIETVVVTGSRFNADAAPAKARLDTNRRPSSRSPISQIRSRRPRIT
jgi:hypothetical protein